MPLSEFYELYLTQHQSIGNRRLHFVGTTAMAALLVLVFVTKDWSYLFLLPLAGYGFAWVGHFVFEKNKPATFQFPLKSFLCDLIMYKDMFIGRVSVLREAHEQDSSSYSNKRLTL